MTPRVKVCGITSKTDALAAIEAGADALGFMFYQKSKRCVTPQQVQAIVQDLPPFISLVGVFVNEELDAIHRAKDQCHLDTIQLHGDESPEFCAKIESRVIKAFRLQSRSVLDQIRGYDTTAWLLDSYSPKGRGGTGDAFNWDWVSEAAPLPKPIIIAGGLSPENVAECVGTTHPFGLDVSSGVEDAPGKKNPDKVRAFVQATHLAALAPQKTAEKA